MQISLELDDSNGLLSAYVPGAFIRHYTVTVKIEFQKLQIWSELLKDSFGFVFLVDHSKSFID